MIKVLKYLVVVILMGVMTISCDDIIISDVEDVELLVISPTDGAVIETNTVNFIWEREIDVERYQLQLVRPDFNTIQNFLVDTFLFDNKFVSESLTDGTYTWRLRAWSGEEFSEYTTNTFRIDGGVLIETAEVILDAPSNEAVIKNAEVNFSWDEIQDAQGYRLQIARPSFLSGAEVIEDTLITQLNYTFSGFFFGDYEWRVRGELDGATSPYTTRSFSIEKGNSLADFIPKGTSPMDSDIISFTDNTVTIFFQWEGSLNADLYVLKVTRASGGTETFEIDVTNSPNPSIGVFNHNFNINLSSDIFSYDVQAFSKDDQGQLVDQSSVSSSVSFEVREIN